tara:strand:- start:737 stop:955 length:219 start_codon:yes stop_codon:yes gene_type:complete
MSRQIEEKFKALERVVERAVATLFGRKKPPTPPKFSDIKDYTSKTGKRFRRTKREIEDGLSPEEAFSKRFLK